MSFYCIHLLLGMSWLGILSKPRHFQVLLQSSSRRLCQAIHPAICFSKAGLVKSLIGFGMLLLLLLLSALRFSSGYGKVKDIDM